jgi:CubicO group peptidase (beta-lactamase class C family)
VLRGYARLGLLPAHDGNWRGRQIIPAAWIRRPRLCAQVSRNPDWPLRLSGLDIGGRAADVRAPPRPPWPGDLRRSGQPPRDGPHGGAQASPRSGHPRGERSLAGSRASAWPLIAPFKRAGRASCGASIT